MILTLSRYFLYVPDTQNVRQNFLILASLRSASASVSESVVGSQSTPIIVTQPANTSHLSFKQADSTHNMSSYN
jgi:hypothetical protein